MRLSVPLIAGATAVLVIISAAIWIYRPAPAFDTTAVLEGNASLERPTAISSAGGINDGVAETVSMANAANALSQTKTFEQIKAEAERGSAIAQRQLSEIYGACMAYSLNSTTQLRTLDHLASLSPESKASIDEVKRRMVARCDKVDFGQPIPMEAISLWAEQAAKNGDVASVVQLRSKSLDPLSGEEATRLADAALASRDPQAMMEMSNLISRPIGDEMPDRYKRVAGNPLAGAAWGIAACRTGAHCNNGSMMMDSLCIGTGRCNYRSYEDFVFAEMVPPAERRRVVTMVNDLLELGQP